MVTGFPPVAEGPGAGAFCAVNPISVQPESTSNASNVPLCVKASTYRRSVALLMVALGGNVPRLNRKYALAPLPTISMVELPKLVLGWLEKTNVSAIGGADWEKAGREANSREKSRRIERVEVVMVVPLC